VFEAGPHLDPLAFRTLDPARVQLLDVREPWEHERVHLQGALLIPLGELVDRVGELDPSRPTAVYCHHGMRSLQALGFLQRVGFTDLAHLAGGIDALGQLDPSVPRY
jgi:sulfur-carrier protein adenylyltransferase/sulfurtransferase